jgi:hypothetical protein
MRGRRWGWRWRKRITESTEKGENTEDRKPRLEVW